MRIAILDDYQDVARTLADWPRLDGRATVTVFNAPFGDADAAAAALAPFNALVCMRERTPLPAELIARLPELQLIVTTGMRNLAIDMDAARTRGIPVCGTASQGAAAAEIAWALILALMKNIAADDRSMRAGDWQPNLGRGLAGKTLSVFGLGKLGAQVATVGRAFGMEVIAWSENLTDARAAEIGVARVDKEAALARADVLSIHLILSARTRGLIGATELARMKPTAFLVNTSRGPIVDEAALIDALKSGTIAGAGLDVYDTEPLPAGHELRRLENTVLSPHTGYVTIENLTAMYRQALEDIEAFLDGAPVRVLN